MSKQGDSSAPESLATPHLTLQECSSADSCGTEDAQPRPITSTDASASPNMTGLSSGCATSVPPAPTVSPPPSALHRPPSSGRTEARGPLRGRGRGATPSATTSSYRAPATAGLASLGEGSTPNPYLFRNGARRGNGYVVDLRDQRSRDPAGTDPSSSSAAPHAAGNSAAGPEDQPPSKILDFLFLGSVNDVLDREFISQNNIGFIINVSNTEYWSPYPNVVVYPFKVRDNTEANISYFFNIIFSLITRFRQRYYCGKREDGYEQPKVLVHCKHGLSRSPTIVIGYLIACNGWSVAEAFEYVSKRRRFVEPNLAFMNALRKLQESIDTEERARCRARLTMIVRNISTRTSAEKIKEFFETRVGCVSDVLMNAHGSTATTRTGGGVHLAVPAKADDKATSQPSQLQPVEHSRTSEYATPGGEGSTGGAAFTQLSHGDAGEAGGKHSVSVYNDPGGSSGGGDGVPAVNDNALCLVFFACFECVGRAKAYASSHREEMKELGPATGRKINLNTPARALNGYSSRTTNTARKSPAAAASGSAVVEGSSAP